MKTDKHLQVARTENLGTHEIIHPVNTLKVRALQPLDGDEAFDEAAILRAERALANLSCQFSDWMQSELDKLLDAYERYSANGRRRNDKMKLYGVAHDIKGVAAIYEFPLPGLVAANLCRLIDEVPDEQCPPELIEQHVLGIKAMIREDVRGNDNELAQTLIAELRRSVDLLISPSANPS